MVDEMSARLGDDENEDEDEDKDEDKDEDEDKRPLGTHSVASRRIGNVTTSLKKVIQGTRSRVAR